MKLLIKHKNRKIEIEMQENSSLGDLVALLMSEYDLNNVKVLFKGMLMKDYTASLKSYGIKDGSSLMLLSTPTESLPKPPTVEVVVKEPTPLEKAVQSLSQIEKSLIDLDTKFSILKNSIRNPTMTPIQTIDYQARELQELLMKLLLKLDAVQFDDDGVRSLRKDIVKRVQLKLNESDDLKIQVGMLKKPSL